VRCVLPALQCCCCVCHSLLCTKAGCGGEDMQECCHLGTAQQFMCTHGPAACVRVRVEQMLRVQFHFVSQCRMQLCKLLCACSVCVRLPCFLLA
jgi:hypothetical protein